MRHVLSNTISDELQISLILIYPDLIRNTFNHKTIEYPIESQSFREHKKTAVTTTIKTVTGYGSFSQLFFLNL